MINYEQAYVNARNEMYEMYCNGLISRSEYIINSDLMYAIWF